MIDYRIGKGVSMAWGVIPGAFAVIRENCIIEQGVTIGAGVYVAPYIAIGEGADVGPHAVILANVPAGAVVPPNIVWDEETAQEAADVTEPHGKLYPTPILPSVHRGRPRKKDVDSVVDRLSGSVRTVSIRRGA